MLLTVGTAIVLLAGLLGGALGAAVGAASALGLAGVVIVVGELATLFVLDGNAVGLLATLGVDGAPTAAGPVSALGVGPLFGPHVAFAGGVGAAAYAARKGPIDTGFRYHQAKQIRRPLFGRPRAVLVGGCFGVAGVALGALGSYLPVDPVAFAVVGSALLVRLTVGYPLVGRFDGKRLLDMSPFEEGAYWGGDGYDTADGIAGRHAVEPWQPRYYEWWIVAIIGVVGGAVGAVLALATDSVYLPFGLSLVSLFALVFGLRVGRYPIPVTFHVVLPAAIAALAVGNGFPLGLASGTAMGVVGAGLGELGQRVFYAHGDTHVDPAFVSLLLSSLLISVLVLAGVFDGGPVPYL
ncbi:hypothetical protein GRX03_11090 [Halovenus sp. WSH3]|uniref:DUF7973 domain-containing protein n=1 Tax=Halovenus carboxidivorans TaxID=2692199 RepID=A0A6B0T9V4_9EURY|nr:hypothetical protein [Halovenus carboxidivorans]MXR52142.1 hypothetical protein [Halovenus carboxidivorans]